MTTKTLGQGIVYLYQSSYFKSRSHALYHKRLGYGTAPTPKKKKVHHSH